jgi:hypothetical protein
MTCMRLRYARADTGARELSVLPHLQRVRKFLHGSIPQLRGDVIFDGLGS